MPISESQALLQPFSPCWCPRRKLEAKDSAGKEGQEGGNEEESKGDGATAVLSEAAVASIGGEGGDPKGGSEGAVSACDA